MLRRRSVEVNTHCPSGYRLCTEVVAPCPSLTQPPPRRAVPGIFPVNESFLDGQHESLLLLPCRGWRRPLLLHAGAN